MQLKIARLSPPLVGETPERVWLVLNTTPMYRGEYAGTRVQFDELEEVFLLVYRRPGCWSFSEKRTGRFIAKGPDRAAALRKGIRRLENMLAIKGLDFVKSKIRAWPDVMTVSDSAPVTVSYKDSDTEQGFASEVKPIRFR